MADDSPLEHPEDVYAPFSANEVKRLHEYVTAVEELVECDLLKSDGWKWKIEGGQANDPVLQHFEYPGERAVRDTAVVFRPLYNDHEASSYNHVIKLLSEHIRESPRRQEALDALRALRKWKGEVLRMPGVAFNINGDDLTPEKLIDLWLHGRYLHKGNAKSDLIDALPFAALLQSEFMDVMYRLSHVFWVGHNVAKLVLAAPSLLPAPAIASS